MFPVCLHHKTNNKHSSSGKIRNFTFDYIEIKGSEKGRSPTPADTILIPIPMTELGIKCPLVYVAFYYHKMYV